MIDYSDEGRLIGHIVIGLEMLENGREFRAMENFAGQLHGASGAFSSAAHGEMEFGSPKRPKMVGSTHFRYVDNLDAKVNAFQTHIEAFDNQDSQWTPFHRFFERFIYKG